MNPKIQKSVPPYIFSAPTFTEFDETYVPEEIILVVPAACQPAFISPADRKICTTVRNDM
jgi:hypothetical protein